MELYTVDTKYIDYLKEFEPHIWVNEENSRLRPYVGVVMDIGDYKYYAPLSSPKPKHQNMTDRLDFIRLEHRGQLKAVINLNNMIPVDDSLLSKIDIAGITDRFYKDLLNVEMIDIRRKTETILKNSKSIYTKITKFAGEPRNARLVSLCYDFLLLEQKLKDYLVTAINKTDDHAENTDCG